MASKIVFSLAEIAQAVKGRVVGDGSYKIHGAASLEQADATEIAMYYNPAYLDAFKQTKAGAVITNNNGMEHLTQGIVVDDPRFAIIEILELFSVKRIKKHGISEQAIIAESSTVDASAIIHPNVVIAEDCKIGKNVEIFPGVVIGDDCVIGSGVCIYGNVTIYSDTHIGKNTIIHGNATIGSDGFGFVNKNGIQHKIPHYKGVRIGQDVEVGSGVTIDRGSMQNTTIGDGTKIDNQAQIAHNVTLGKNNVISGHACVAGSTITGDNVILGGGSFLADSITVGDNSIIGPFSALAKSLGPNQLVYGYPARPKKTWLQNAAYVSIIPRLIKKIDQLKDRIDMLTNKRD